MTDVKAKRLRAAIEKGATSLDDATALTAVELYPVWVSGQSYDVDMRVQHNGTLYRCVQAIHRRMIGRQTPHRRCGLL